MLTKKMKEPQSSLPHAFLYWKKESCMEQKEIKDFLSIGRENANLLILDDDFVSRNHARIERKTEKGIYILKDMNSQNGVFLNGSRIHQAILNKVHDNLRGLFLIILALHGNLWVKTA